MAAGQRLLCDLSSLLCRSCEARPAGPLRREASVHVTRMGYSQFPAVSELQIVHHHLLGAGCACIISALSKLQPSSQDSSPGLWPGPIWAAALSLPLPLPGPSEGKGLCQALSREIAPSVCQLVLALCHQGQWQ